MRLARRPPPAGPGIRRLAGALPLVLLLATVPARPAAAQSIQNADLFKKSLEATREALQQYGVLDRPQEMRRVADIGYRIVEAAGLTQPPISFYLVDMPEPNAFALPGGQVVVTRGMLDLGLSDDQLASLLGHEIAHVALQHGIKMERRATLLNILSQAALVGVIIGAERGDRRSVDPWGRPDESTGDLIQGTAAAGLVISELLLRSYNREFEDQADEEGQRWAAGAGFSPVGAAELFDVMGRRLPQDKKYGYWQTHPFFDSRVQAAVARGGVLKAQPPRPADALRQKTQAALLEFVATLAAEPAVPDGRGPGSGGPPERRRDDPPPPADRGSAPEGDLRQMRPRLDLRQVVELTAIAAWPAGPASESIRTRALHQVRDRELRHPPLRRDYGRILLAYEREMQEVRAVDPGSAFLAGLETERDAVRTAARGEYPQAVAVLESGVYETAFLETFASNYPDAPQLPSVALALGDAYARLNRTSDAVEKYLLAWRAAPGSDLGARARGGLRVLASRLDDLATLQDLALQPEDPEIRDSATRRLDQRASTYGTLAEGAAYLRRYPSTPLTERVTARLHVLADNLYGEMLLYQTVGDHLKALDRIQQILTHAPASPAAERLRDRTQVGPQPA